MGAESNCNCLTGTPYVDPVTGECKCINNSTPPITNQPIDWNTQRKIFNLTPPLQRTACAGLTAPRGYKYISVNGQCILAVDYDYDTTKFPATTTTGGSGTASGSASAVSNFIANNKPLVYIAAAFAAFKMFGKGTGRPVKSRETTTSERY